MFGNSFDGTYLKLAYVEVLQDDVHWYLEPNYSLTPKPAGTSWTYLNNMDPTNISGLAGKYIVGYGTPFSLSDAIQIGGSGVGLPWADYVRLVDVIGDGSNLDSAGNPIYDPWPNSNGFNAAGVGVLSVGSAVPEPSSLVLISIGAGLLGLCAKRSLFMFRGAKPVKDRF